MSSIKTFSLACRTRLVVAVALVLFSIAVIYSQHYEPGKASVINGYSFAWVFLFISIGLATFVAIYYHKDISLIEKLGIIIHGLCTLLFATAFPYLTGSYMIGRSDTMAHLGWIRDILELGTITSSLIYPVFHLLSAALSLIGGFEPHWSMVVTIVATIIGTSAAMVAIADRVIERPRSKLFIWGFVVLVLLSFPFRTYHISYYPIGLTTLYLPIAILSAFHVLEGHSRSTALVIFVFVALAHPFGLVYVLLLLGVIVSVTLSLRSHISFNLTKSSLVMSAACIVFLFGFLWYDHAGTFGHTILNAYETLFVDTGTGSNVEHTSSTLEGLPIIEFVAIRYSPHLFLIVATVVTPVILYYRSPNKLIFFLILYIWGTLALVFGVTGFFTTSLVGPLRFLDAAPAVWVSIFALLYLATEKNISHPNKNTWSAIIFIILIVSLPVTLISGFPAPLTYQYSWEVSHEDTSTKEWWVEYGDEQYTESLGLHGRTIYGIKSFTESQQYDSPGDFETYGGRAHIFGTDELLIQRVRVGDTDTLLSLEDNQLIILTGWHTAHASNTRLTEARDIPDIQEQYDEEGAKWLETQLNKPYTNGDTTVTSP